MAKIGDYVHYYWTNFLKYGYYFGNRIIGGKQRQPHVLTSAKETFVKQIAFAKAGLKQKQIIDPLLEKIQDQLDRYYNSINGSIEINDKIPEDQLNKLREAIIEMLGEKLKDIKIDEKTLKASVENNSYDEKIFEEIEKGEEILNNLQALAKRKPLGTKVSTSFKAVKTRVNALLELREAMRSMLTKKSLTAEVLFSQLLTLEQEWKKLETILPRGKIVYSAQPEARIFVQDLNNLIKTFKVVSIQEVQGTYAEAIIAAIGHILTAEATKNTGEILNILKENIKGQERSKGALIEANFSKNIPLAEVVKDTPYANAKSKTDFGYISSKKTQDKVDIIYHIDDLNIPASVKNIDFTNRRDIKLLEGSSILQIVQEYEEFVNYYLNIAAVHPTGGPSSVLSDTAHLAMKMTILLHALQGGVEKLLTSGKASPSDAAEIFIVNDNSTGRIKVFSMAAILDRVSQDMTLLKIKNFENIQELNNDFVGSKKHLSLNDAWTRIAHLLAQLHNIQIEVSISKQAIPMGN